MFLCEFLGISAATQAALFAAASVGVVQTARVSSGEDSLDEVLDLDHFGSPRTVSERSKIVGYLNNPPGEVTNAQVEVVHEAYPDVHRGIFIRDTQPGRTRGLAYLFATGGRRTPLSQFEILDPKLLPPGLGISEGQRVDDFMKENPGVLGDRTGRFQIERQSVWRKWKGKDSLGSRSYIRIQKIMPSLDRYDVMLGRRGFEARLVEFLKRPEEGATMIDYWQAQALAQLFGGRGLMGKLFGLSGVHYVDLPTEVERYYLEGILRGKFPGRGTTLSVWTKDPWYRQMVNQAFGVKGGRSHYFNLKEPDDSLPSESIGFMLNPLFARD